MTIAFDTLKLADRLAEGGFSPQQAKTAASALSEAFTAEMATKADLLELRLELKSQIADVRNEIAELRTEIAPVRIEIANAKTEMVKWLVGAIGFQTVVIIGTVITLLKTFAK